MKGKRKKGGGSSSEVRDSQKRQSSSKVEKGGKPFQQQKLTFDLVDLDDPVSASQATSFTSTQAWRIPNRKSHSEAVPLSGTSPRTGSPSCVSGDVSPGGGDGEGGMGAGLWVERFAPKWEDELAVHRKKVQEVSQWFDAHFGPPVMHRPVQQSKGKGSKQKAAGGGHKGDASTKQPSKVLALVGPPGCGKTALVHVVAAARGVTVQDWQAPVPLLWDDRRHIRSSQAAAGVEHQEKLASFSDFIRSSRLFSPLALSTAPTPTSTTTPAPTLAPPQAPQPSARSPPPTASPTSHRLPSTMPPPSRPPLSGKRNKASLPVSAAERQTTSRGRGVVQRPEGVREGRRGEKTGREEAKAGGTKGMEGNSKGRRSNSVESWEGVGETRDGDGDEADEEDGGDDEEWLPSFRESSDAHGARGKAKEKKQVVKRGSQDGSAPGAVVSGRHVGASAVPSSPLLPPSPPALPAPPSPSTSLSPASPSRHVLLIDDLPFVSGRQRCDALCHAMHSLATASHVPAVVVLSLPTTSTSAASASAPGGARGGMRGEWRQGDGVPTRDVLDALMSGGAHKVEFNPIAPGAMHKALAAVAAAAGSPLAAPAVAAVAESSAGDLRHAISQLQLLSLSTRQPPSHTWDPGGAAAGGRGSVGMGEGGEQGCSGSKSEGTEQGKRRKKRKVQQSRGSTELVDLTHCESSGGGEEEGGCNRGVLRPGSGGAATAGAGGSSGGAEDAAVGAGRDDPLSLFHAVGKFLHNKRLPAAQHKAEAEQRSEREWVANPLRWQQWGQSSSQQVITGDSHQCAPGPDAPIGNAGDGGMESSGGDGVSGGSAVAVREELQRAAVDMEAAEVIIQRSQIAPMKLCCYLHENMLDMLHPCDGLEAAVGASAALSDVLTLLSSSSSHLSSWSGGSSMAADGVGGGDEDLSPAAVRAAAAASVAARGVMFWNTQPAPKRMATTTFAPAVSANLRQGCPSPVAARSARLSSSFLAVPLRRHASASRAVVAAPHRRPDVRASFGAPSSGALTPELKSALDKFISENKVILFMKGNKQFPQCGFSNTCVQILTTLNVPFETVNILEDDRLRQGMKEYSSWPTFPQLYIDGEFYGGCDITIEGFQSGELKETIEKALLS
ncbi:unnamed protein product [Closterium sp. Naga37s-1]|nr:unnamed protein product [Closterium sp. Naga37s-1]